MKQEALAYFTDVKLTLLALFLFVVTFTGIVLWVYKFTKKEHFNEMAMLPLTKRDDHVE